MKGGLKPLVRDERDLQLGAIFTPPESIPSQYTLPFYEYYAPKDQRDTDFCSAFASTTAMELTEEERLSPEFFFATSKLLTNDPDAWGQDLRSACKNAKENGALEQRLAPHSLETQQQDFLRRIENWGDLPPLLNNAIIHRQLGYASCRGFKDGFDNIKDWIWKFQKPVIMGVEWGWPPDNAYIDELASGYGHAIVAVGWKLRDGKEYLVIQNSWGNNGDNGKFYLSRNVVNDNVSRYGAMMFTDISPEMARHYQENGIKVDQPWLAQLITQLYNLTLGKLVELVVITKAKMVIDRTKLETMAKAMMEFEDYVPPGGKTRGGEVLPLGSISYRCNNPGNLKWSKFQIGTKLGHANFATFEDGWKALLFQIEIGFDGRSRVYKPTDSLYKFFEKYCEANQKPYAESIAKALGVEPTQTLFDVLKTI